MRWSHPDMRSSTTKDQITVRAPSGSRSFVYPPPSPLQKMGVANRGPKPNIHLLVSRTASLQSLALVPY